MKPLRLLFKIFPILMIFIFSSCQEVPEYPSKPRLEFKSIELNVIDENGFKANQIIITTRFEDGDGDLGLSDADIQAAPHSDRKENYFLEAYFRKKGSTTFQKIALLSQKYRFLRLNPDDRVGPIEGDLRYTIQSVPEDNIFDISTGDEMKFEVEIIDRAGNKSNKIETAPITMNFN